MAAGMGAGRKPHAGEIALPFPLFGGMQGGRSPLPKGSVAVRQCTLEPCRSKTGKGRVFHRGKRTRDEGERRFTGAWRAFLSPARLFHIRRSKRTFFRGVMLLNVLCLQREHVLISGSLKER